MVFYGYGNVWSIKTAEHKRCYFTIVPEVVSDENTVMQNSLLSYRTRKIKKSLIDILMIKLIEEKIALYKAEDEANSLIVHAAINYSATQKTIMLAHDTDLIVNCTDN